MATITLSYDARNISVKNLIQSLLNLGLVKEEKSSIETETPKSKTLKAIKEIDEGKGTRCKTFEEYKKSVMK